LLHVSVDRCLFILSGLSQQNREEVAECASDFIDKIISEEAQAGVEGLQEEVEQGTKEARDALLIYVDDQHCGVFGECE